MLLCHKKDYFKLDDNKEKNDNPKINIVNLVREHGKDLRKFICYHLWNKNDVDDIYQSTFLEAIRCAKNFRGESTPKTWLFGIAFNLIRNQCRKPVGELSVNISVEDDCQYKKVNGYGTDDPYNIIERKEILDFIVSNKILLPNKIVQTLVNVIINESSYAQVAEELSIPLGTVQSRVARAREMIRAKLL
ncbi:RNA polymerase sigma factor [Endozoicomonas sp. SM1973]|uniref:RNA polymerase sigma factor n=1 Tax=Spartinivicinus marinus TaxID=2994442 RepID=A0A853I9G2_9GAMM|nr:RNA polymerase sigma factor [Spartinivicinus marinus]MCX4028138.1 RNA polymerase sigma factor [Spartinivicinus marinus]NYZ66187.1 RNA polymerase sigma factor [Spartinivicinus marinus]